jgi:hypothetical protein
MAAGVCLVIMLSSAGARGIAWGTALQMTFSLLLYGLLFWRRYFREFPRIVYLVGLATLCAVAPAVIVASLKKVYFDSVLLALVAMGFAGGWFALVIGCAFKRWVWSRAMFAPIQAPPV